jgi:D-arabinose 1-dehydrogenase-like Zn-dependent alcohol dehydrogenase
MIEKFPLQQAQIAFDKMLKGKMRFRGVLIKESNLDMLQR